MYMYAGKPLSRTDSLSCALVFVVSMLFMVFVVFFKFYDSQYAVCADVVYSIRLSGCSSADFVHIPSLVIGCCFFLFRFCYLITSTPNSGVFYKQ